MEEFIQYLINQNQEFSILLSTVFGFVINQFFSKNVLLVAKQKKIFYLVGYRSSHSSPVPALGGISLFAVFVCTTLTMVGFGASHSLGFVILSAFILFMAGLKDDLIESSVLVKLAIQIGVAILVLIDSELRLTHLNGFLGIGAITPYFGYLISLGFIVFLINAYNLIDGIDGLAGSVAIVALSVFGVYYFVNGFTFLLIITASMIGALIGFLTWNFASPKKKMLLGNSGSQFIGFFLAANSLLIIAKQPINSEPFIIPQNAIIFVMSILVVPILDTLRIIILRLFKGQKPWVADRNHMHHLLLDKGLSHKQATFCLVSLQVIAIIGFIGVNNLGPIAQHLFLICLFCTYTTIFFSASVTRK